MSYPITINWIQNSDHLGEIAYLQSSTSAGFLSGPPYTYPASCGWVRMIKLSSTSNNSGVSFVIIGVGYDSSSGQLKTLTETISGPNNNSVYSSHMYSSIQSIKANSAYTNVSASVADIGWGLIKLDYNRANFKTSVQIDTNIGSGTNVTAQVTNDLIEKPTSNGLSFNFNNITWFTPTSAGTATGQAVTIPVISTFPITPSTTGFVEYFTPATAFYFKFGTTGSPGTFTGGAKIVIQQQGIRS